LYPRHSGVSKRPEFASQGLLGAEDAHDAAHRVAMNKLRLLIHKSHPNAGRSKFDDSEVICVVFFATRCDGPEMSEFIEEPSDEITKPIESDGLNGEP
jgi:hypothetical protein